MSSVAVLTFAAALRKRREELGLGAGDLARLVGVDREVVDRLESNSTSIRDWSWGQADTLRQMLGWSPCEFVQLIEQDRIRSWGEPDDDKNRPGHTPRTAIEFVFRTTLESLGGFNPVEADELARMVIGGGCNQVSDELRARYLRYLLELRANASPKA
ncbi:helix-turn-helix domain-containing protein [Oceanithermus sp.]|uniref:helix-turn-helix domain-containing protein n=1 Tax=Oceanithermus sp. TaxID=2268145 RepID=UPI0025CEB835|nr:helix-turn-helix domain-containing protein [Oceanithermus sp.]